MGQAQMAEVETTQPMVDVDRARDFLLARARPIHETEELALAGALGRVLAGRCVSPIDVPGFANSQMDGYAVRSAELHAGGTTRLRVAQRIAAGASGAELLAGEAARIFTGAPLPPGADAVVMQENCRTEGDTVVVLVPVASGENVRPRGNNIRAHSTLLESGARLRPQALGVAAAVGLTRLRVVRRPRVAVLSSGDELVAPGLPLPPAAIYNANAPMLAALLAQLGCEVIDGGIVPDTFDASRRALEELATSVDLIISSGGVSVGEEDHMRAALESVGELKLWRIAVKPGKPLAYGRLAGGGADFLGLPGNPVSALVTFCLFVRPFLLRRLGAIESLPRFRPVPAGFSWPRPGARREYPRARLVADANGRWRAELFERQGSDVLSSTVWADGLVEIAEGRRVEEGEVVPYASFDELLA